MSSIRLYSSATLILASALFVACSDSTGPSEVTVDSIFAELRDAQQSVSTAKGGTDDVMLVGVPILPFSAIPSPTSCAFEATTERFVCPAITHAGITTSLYYQLLDAANQPQSAFNPATTAAIRTVNDISGTMTTSSPSQGTMTVNGHGDHTLSGLLTDTHTLNGSSTTKVDMSLTFNGQQFNDSFTLTETTTNLVLPKRGSATHYPQSGSIAMDITSSDGTAVHITITFDGTNIATIVISGTGFNETCKVNLTDPHAPESCVSS